MALFLIVFHFALPFLLLLSRTAKRTGRILCRLAMVIFFMRFVDLFWTVVPSFEEKGLFLDWMHIVAPIGLGGIWMAFFIGQLKKRPLLPVSRKS